MSFFPFTRRRLYLLLHELFLIIAYVYELLSLGKQISLNVFEIKMKLISILLFFCR